MKTLKVTMLALALVGFAGAAQATVHFGISDSTYVAVGGASASTVDDHGGEAGDPAIGVNAFYGGARVSFAGLQSLGSTTGSGTSSDPYVTRITPAMMPPSHAALGYFNFAQAGAESVYFGEWSNAGSSSSSQHAVYYAGESGDVATTLPSGTATYTVKSINNAYSTSSVLPTSTLTANFGSSSASSTGDINFTGGTITVGGTDRVQLAASNVSVTSVSGTSGALSGDFFGTGAAAVAGIVTFSSDHTKDVAFGGVKN